MPQVGDEEFAYTPEGQAKAQKKSLETGQPVIPSYDAGGRVKKIPGYVHGGLVDPQAIRPLSEPSPRSPLPELSPITPRYEKGGKVKKEKK